MKKMQMISVIVYTILVVNFVAAVVFLNGANQQTPQMNTSRQNTTVIAPSPNQIPANALVTRAQLSEHDTQEDCWISYESKVYDITSWLPHHPGSAGAIAPYCGTAEEFERAFSGQHGSSQVGTLTREGVYKGELQ